MNDYVKRAVFRIIQDLGYTEDQITFIGKILSLEDEQTLVEVVQAALQDRESDGKEAALTINKPREARLKVELRKKVCNSPTTLTQLLRDALCRRGLKPGDGYSLEEKGACKYELRLNYELIDSPKPLLVTVTFEPTSNTSSSPWP